MYVHEHLRYAESLSAHGTSRRASCGRCARRSRWTIRRSCRRATCVKPTVTTAARTSLFAKPLRSGRALRRGDRGRPAAQGRLARVLERPGHLRRARGVAPARASCRVRPAHPRSGARALPGRSASVTAVSRTSRDVCLPRRRARFRSRSVTVNGQALQFDREENPYRQGGAVMPLERFMGLLGPDGNRVEVEI